MQMLKTYTVYNFITIKPYNFCFYEKCEGNLLHIPIYYYLQNVWRRKPCSRTLAYFTNEMKLFIS